MKKLNHRYQGAIMRDKQILLIQHREHSGRSYWLLPGGGREEGETEEECVQREMCEETGLEVQVGRLLLDIPKPSDTSYHRHKTYLCTPTSPTEPQPGYEPEPWLATQYAIAAVRWVDLFDESSWGQEVISDAITYPTLKALQETLQA